MMVTASITALAEAVARRSDWTLCTLGFNCFEPWNKATQVSGIAEIQRPVLCDDRKYWIKEIRCTATPVNTCNIRL
jgi:hypothetical protein